MSTEKIQLNTIEEAIEDIDWDEKIKEAFCGLRVELVPR